MPRNNKNRNRNRNNNQQTVSKNVSGGIAAAGSATAELPELPQPEQLSNSTLNEARDKLELIQESVDRIKANLQQTQTSNIELATSNEIVSTEIDENNADLNKALATDAPKKKRNRNRNRKKNAANNNDNSSDSHENSPIGETFAIAEICSDDDPTTTGVVPNETLDTACNPVDTIGLIISETKASAEPSPTELLATIETDVAISAEEIISGSVDQKPIYDTLIDAKRIGEEDECPVGSEQTQPQNEKSSKGGKKSQKTNKKQQQHKKVAEVQETKLIDVIDLSKITDEVTPTEDILPLIESFIDAPIPDSVIIGSAHIEAAITQISTEQIIPADVEKTVDPPLTVSENSQVENKEVPIEQLSIETKKGKNKKDKNKKAAAIEQKRSLLEEIAEDFEKNTEIVAEIKAPADDLNRESEPAILDEKKIIDTTKDVLSDEKNETKVKAIELVDEIEVKDIDSIDKIELKPIESIDKIEAKAIESVDIIEEKPKESTDIIGVKPKKSIDIIEVKPNKSTDIIGVKSKKSTDIIEVKPKESTDIIGVKPKESTDIIGVKPKESTDIIEVKPKVEKQQKKVKPFSAIVENEEGTNTPTPSPVASQIIDPTKYGKKIIPQEDEAAKIWRILEEASRSLEPVEIQMDDGATYFEAKPAPNITPLIEPATPIVSEGKSENDANKAAESLASLLATKTATSKTNKAKESKKSPKMASKHEQKQSSKPTQAKPVESKKEPLKEIVQAADRPPSPPPRKLSSPDKKTALADISSLVEKTSSPMEKATSSVEKAASPLTKASSKKSPSPSEKLSSSPKKTRSPVEKAPSPPKRAEKVSSSTSKTSISAEKTSSATPKKPLTPPKENRLQLENLPVPLEKPASPPEKSAPDEAITISQIEDIPLDISILPSAIETENLEQIDSKNVQGSGSVPSVEPSAADATESLGLENTTVEQSVVERTSKSPMDKVKKSEKPAINRKRVDAASTARSETLPSSDRLKKLASSTENKKSLPDKATASKESTKRLASDELKTNKTNVKQLAQAKAKINAKPNVPPKPDHLSKNSTKVASPASKITSKPIIGEKNLILAAETNSPYDSEEEYIEYKFMPRQVFISTICQSCKIPTKADQRMFCTKCQMVVYCCGEHYIADDPLHKDLCAAIQEIARKRGGHIYNNARILNDSDYRSLRVHTLNMCESILNRPLQTYEREILLFPRLCSKTSCREWRQNFLVDCPNCTQVFHCMDNPEHKPNAHERWCKALALYQKFVVRQSISGRIEPNLPSRVFNKPYILPNSIADVFNDLYKSYNDLKDDCVFATLTQLATAPLTAYYATRIADAKIGEKFTIHLVGAELQFEADILDIWETFFLHLFPKLVELTIVFCGPELNAENIPLDIISRIRMCRLCRQSCRIVKFDFQCAKLYHDYAKTNAYSKPDLICFFNPGFHHINNYDISGRDSWTDTIKVAAVSNCPIVVTSYTEFEAPKDLSRFQAETGSDSREMSIILGPQLNPYASQRPERNFISDELVPLIFKNYYCFVAK